MTAEQVETNVGTGLKCHSFGSLALTLAKLLHLGRALSDFVRFHRFFSLTSYFPLFFPRFEDDVTDGRGIKGLLVLQFGRKIDAVILADVADGIRWKFLGFRCDAEDFENLPPSGKVSAEGSGTDVGQSCLRALNVCDNNSSILLLTSSIFPSLRKPTLYIGVPPKGGTEI